MENKKFIDSEKYKRTLDNLFTILKEIKHILIINLNEIFLKDVLKNLKVDPLIHDTIDLLKLVNYDISKIAHSDEYLNFPKKENIYNSQQIINNIDLNSIKDIENNKFSLLSKKLQIIFNEISLISNNYCDEVNDIIEQDNLKIKEEKKIKKPKNEKQKQIRMKNKKSYEVDVLSRYMINIFNKNNIKNLIELGCGKSYLTNNILIQEDMVYIGIDKQDHLIEKSEKFNTNNNIFLINEIVDFENFNRIFLSQIKENLFTEKFQEKFKNDKISIMESNEFKDKPFSQNIMLFGLHSCGNLTSDSIKIFVKNNVLTHLVIVGCCLNLLIEYISKENKNSNLFKSYIDSIGFDNRGTFLEKTMLYDYDFHKIGYPLSNYIRTEYQNIFLGRSLRNIAMQSIPKECDNIIDSKNQLKYKNLMFRTMLQVFFEEYLIELKFVYGYGKLKLDVNDNFTHYTKNFLIRVEYMINNNELITKDFENKNIKKKIEKLRENIIDNCAISNNSNLSSEDSKIFDNTVFNEKEIDSKDKINLEEFFGKYSQYEDILWAFYVIRIKFAKIIEYIIALDRIIFLKENNVKNVELVKIFDHNKSARNLLIYASKLN